MYTYTHTHACNACNPTVAESSLSYSDMFDPKADPQVGATTAYHNLSFVATEQIDAGQELFIGGMHLEDDEHYAKGFPRREDYYRAREILNGLTSYRKNHLELGPVQWIGT